MDRLMESLYGKSVVVRSAPSGVWFGVLEGALGGAVRLTSARRCWEWYGAGCCSGLATYGPAGGRISAPVNVVVAEVCEVIEASEEAEAALARVPVWGSDE